MLKIVKDSVLKVSRSLGYDIAPWREMRERDFALHLRELLTRLNVDCVDVGRIRMQHFCLDLERSSARSHFGW